MPTILQSIVSRTIILLLLLSLGIRSVVPQGLMIVREGTFGFNIILCDGSNGLGSIPAFRKKQPDNPHGSMAHHVAAHPRDETQHHRENSKCEECDFLWASNGIEDAIYSGIDIQFYNYNGNVLFHKLLTQVILSERSLVQARAPPPLFS